MRRCAARYCSMHVHHKRARMRCQFALTSFVSYDSGIGSAGSRDAFHEAARLHGAGKLDEAERLYNAVLASNADHFGALHSLGIIAAQRRKFSAADELLRRALSVDP